MGLTEGSFTLIVGARLVRIIVGSLGRLMVLSVKKLMIFSSVYAIGWVLLAVVFCDKGLFIRVYRIYCIGVVLVSGLIHTAGGLPHVPEGGGLHYYAGLALFIITLAIGGLPPGPVFFYKVYILLQIANCGMTVVAAIALIGSVILIYSYVTVFVNHVLIPIGSISSLNINSPGIHYAPIIVFLITILMI